MKQHFRHGVGGVHKIYYGEIGRAKMENLVVQYTKLYVVKKSLQKETDLR